MYSQVTGMFGLNLTSLANDHMVGCSVTGGKRRESEGMLLYTYSRLKTMQEIQNKIHYT